MSAIVSLPENRLPIKKKIVHDGARKILFEGPDPGTYTLHFRDRLIEDGLDPQEIPGKGCVVNRISELFMGRLQELRVNTHFLKRLNMREQIVRVLDPLPCYLTIYNASVDEFKNRFQTELSEPLFELGATVKNIDHIVSPQHILSLGWSDPDEIDRLFSMAQRINDFVQGQFIAVGLRLLRIQLRFGRMSGSDPFQEPQLFLMDEISPDSCRLEDVHTQKRWDSYTIAHLENAGISFYRAFAKRLGIHLRGDIAINDENEKESQKEDNKKPVEGSGESFNFDSNGYIMTASEEFVETP